MAVCVNCGEKIPFHSKFCPNCGMEIGRNAPELQTQGKTTYIGEVRKCSRCGAVLSAFETNCPECGMELREIKATSSAQELANRISEIETERRKANRSFGKSLLNRLNLTEDLSDKSIANIIRTWAVPNTKEDIYEFMTLAAANIDAKLLTTKYVDPKDEPRKLQCEAWLSKFEQVYMKGKISFGNTAEFHQIKEIYDNKHYELEEPDRKRKKQLTIILIIIGVLMLLSVISQIFGIAQASDTASIGHNTYPSVSSIEQQDNSLSGQKEIYLNGTIQEEH